MQGAAALILTLKRGSTSIHVEIATSAYGPGMFELHFLDSSPPSGTHTYELQAGNIPGEGINNRIIILEELKVWLPM